MVCSRCGASAEGTDCFCGECGAKLAASTSASSNFFDNHPGADFQGLMDYVKSHTPVQLLDDLRASSVDPNDLPMMGDMVRMFREEAGYAHARVLYAEGIRRLEAEPARKAPDVDLMFARRNLCVCCLPGEPVEAMASLRADPTIVAADPVLAIAVGMRLVQQGQAGEAAELVEWIDRIPRNDLLAKLSEAKIGLADFERAEAGLRPEPLNYQGRLIAQFNSAPAPFRKAFALLSEGEIADAAQAFTDYALANSSDAPLDWCATACCCAAWCLAELDNFQEAILLAKTGKKQGFLEFGAFYYYTASWRALNQLDKLPEAAAVADEAIAYFREHGSPGDVCSNLGRKANILKQMASHLSRSSEPARARPVIVQAIHAMCDSINIDSSGWEEECGEELEAMGAISRRVGVSRRDLTFLNAMPAVDALVSRFFAR